MKAKIMERIKLAKDKGMLHSANWDIEPFPVYAKSPLSNLTFQIGCNVYTLCGTSITTDSTCGLSTNATKLLYHSFRDQT